MNTRSMARGGLSTRRLIVVGVLICTLLLQFGGLALAASITIDTFETTQDALAASHSSPTDSSTVTGPGILGGERDMEVTWVGGSGEVGALVYSDSLIHSQAATARGTTLVTWDGADGDATTIAYTGLGVDLTTDGTNTQDRFVLEVSSDAVGGPIVITVYTDASNYSTYTVNVTGSSTTVEIPYNSFTTASGTGANFTNVGAITLLIDGSSSAQQAWDLEILSFSTAEPPGPTAVSLSAFSATVQDGAVVLTWSTSSELDNMGFNLYRGTSPDGPDTRLNGELITSQLSGTMAGASYEFTDTQVKPGVVTVYYWLEDVDFDGVATRHGPLLVRLLVLKN